jgi:hypothetical protein
MTVSLLFGRSFLLTGDRVIRYSTKQSRHVAQGESATLTR